MSSVCPWCTGKGDFKFRKSSNCTANAKERDLKGRPQVKKCYGLVCGTCGRCNRQDEHK